MKLESERLTLRKCTPADLPSFLDLATRDEVMKYITGKGLTASEARKRFAANLEVNTLDPDYGFFMACSKNGETIGYGKLVKYTEGEYEAGYSLHPDHWGKGYATEILDTLIRYASADRNIRSLMAKITPANTASRKVLEKKGFVSYLLEYGDEGGTEYFRLELGRPPQKS